MNSKKYYKIYSIMIELIDRNLLQKKEFYFISLFFVFCLVTLLSIGIVKLDFMLIVSCFMIIVITVSYSVIINRRLLELNKMMLLFKQTEKIGLEKTEIETTLFGAGKSRIIDVTLPTIMQKSAEETAKKIIKKSEDKD